MRQVNSFGLNAKAATWKDLEDGQLLWDILRMAPPIHFGIHASFVDTVYLGDIDPDYFPGSLPELDTEPSKNWIPRWQNLKHVERSVTTYIRDACERLPVLTKKISPDIKSMAEGGSFESTAKLVKLVLLAACYSEKSNERVVTMMMKLGQDVAVKLADVVKECEELDGRMAAYGVDPGIQSSDFSVAGEEPTSLKASTGSYERDTDLEHEEELIKAAQARKKLEERIAQLEMELQDEREKMSEIQTELEEAKSERGRKGQYDDQEFEKMNAKNSRDQDYIA
ncbi:hypothetical protein LTS18_000377, partial [Coniosporium uncinatum]